MADVQITVPVSEEPGDGYCPKEFMVTGLTDEEFQILHRIRRGLKEQGATIGATAVGDSRHVVRWLLAQIATA